MAKISISCGPFPISYNTACVLVTKNSTQLRAGKQEGVSILQEEKPTVSSSLHLCLNEYCRTHVNVNHAHRAENIPKRNHIMVMFSC